MILSQKVMPPSGSFRVAETATRLMFFYIKYFELSLFGDSYIKFHAVVGRWGKSALWWNIVFCAAGYKTVR